MTIWTALGVGRHLHHGPQIEATVSQGTGGRKQTEGRVPHRWLGKRRPLQRDDHCQPKQELNRQRSKCRSGVTVVQRHWRFCFDCLTRLNRDPTAQHHRTRRCATRPVTTLARIVSIERRAAAVGSDASSNRGRLTARQRRARSNRATFIRARLCLAVKQWTSFPRNRSTKQTEYLRARPLALKMLRAKWLIA